MTEKTEYIVSCDTNLKSAGRKQNYLALSYREPSKKEVDLCFYDTFEVETAEERVKDFMEISSYLYAAEIKFKLNSTDEMNVNPKKFNFHLSVRDLNFWKQQKIRDLLNELLYFLTGNEYRFIFSRLGQQKNRKRTRRKNSRKEKTLVTFLSGGIDSTAGIIDLLENNPGAKISLVSHQPGLSGITTTQDQLFQKISDLYPGRCSHVRFRCRLFSSYAFEKDYPTRSLLYHAVAFAVSKHYGEEQYYLYENGVSAINFKGINSFDDSTGFSCHPKTLSLLAQLFTQLSNSNFTIEQPFLFKTKTEVVCALNNTAGLDLLNYTVSCNRHHSIPSHISHCGICPPCITRRNTLLAAGYQKDQRELFYYNLPAEIELSSHQKEKLNSMLKEIIFFSRQNFDGFCRLWKDELFSLEGHTRHDTSHSDVMEDIYDLCNRHFQDMRNAINTMRDLYDSPWAVYRRGYFFTLLDESRGYTLELWSNVINEADIEYRHPAVSCNSPVLNYVPSKKLKETVAEQCNELIEREVITDKTSDKELGDKVISVLSIKYILTEANKRSIMDYFRKGVLQIRKENGKYIVINNNRSNDFSRMLN